MKYVLLLAALICVTQSVRAQEECEAMDYFELAKKGSVVEQALVGKCFYRQKNYKEASKWTRRAAEQGDEHAQYRLSDMYLNGEGVPQNDKKYYEWLRKAAEKGSGMYQYDLGFTYENGKGVYRDYKEAFRLYRKAAEQGIRNAQARLGDMYSKGRGVPQNYEKCYVWLNIAVAKGHFLFEEKRDMCAEKLTPESLQRGQEEAARLFELYR